MRVLGREVLEKFKQDHADVRQQLDAWLQEAKDAHWETRHDIKARYSSVSFLKENIVIFNIKGNNYRLVTKINFQHQIIKVEKIGTHAEYSKWEW